MIPKSKCGFRTRPCWKRATATQLTNKTLTAQTAKDFAIQFFNGQVSEDARAFGGFKATPVVVITPITDANGGMVWQVSVSVKGQQKASGMAAFVGRNKLDIQVGGKAESGSNVTRNAVSMALVLDKSGSMDWYGPTANTGRYPGAPKKIASLKSAVDSLLTQLAEADPDKEYVRIGGAAFDNSLYDTEKMRWGTAKVSKFVNDLPASGGTDSADAFKWSFQQLTKATETTEHAKKTGLVPDRIIVFMTDGENNFDAADVSTLALCNTAKLAKVEIYTVAFMAPARGKALLSACASTAAHHFEASSSAELVKAFKSIGMKAANMVSRLTQ